MGDQLGLQRLGRPVAGTRSAPARVRGGVAASLPMTVGCRERRVVTQHVRTARVLALATAVTAVVGGAWTASDPGLLHGPAAMQGSARGTALVLLLVTVPVLLISLWRALQGSGAALLTWGGDLLHVVYIAVLLIFLKQFNGAYLVDVAMRGTPHW